MVTFLYDALLSLFAAGDAVPVDLESPDLESEAGDVEVELVELAELAELKDLSLAAFPLLSPDR